MKTARLLDRWVAPGFLFLLALLPRAIYPVSRTALWYKRSILFIDAVLAGDWASTFQRYHPGVTTMWLSGAAVKLFGVFRHLSSAQLLGDERTPVGTLHSAYGAGVLALALVVALSIVLVFTLINRLVNREVGLIAGLLLALDPVFLSQSKELDLDALLAAFMLISALYLVAYIRESRLADLVLSGVFGGLALLTKSPALFLLPYATLLVGAQNIGQPVLGAGVWQRIVRQLRPFPHMAQTLAIWLGIAGLIFCLLFPAMWVNPAETLKMIAGHSSYHLSVPHYNPTFFNGQVLVRENPGPLYYLATILWRTPGLVLLLFLLAALLTFGRLRSGQHSPTVWWLAVYVGGFAAQMSLSARKEMRYLTPVSPAIDVLAAYGLVELGKALRAVWHMRRPRWLPRAVMALALAVQGIIVLAHHPYYGTHFNYLLGGPRMAREVLPLQEQGEGLDLAGLFLNSLPNAEKATVVMHPLAAEMVLRYTVSKIDAGCANPRADYRLYTLNQVMRRVDADQWEAAWLADQQTEPLWTVEFGGLTYVWIYGRPPG